MNIQKKHLKNGQYLTQVYEKRSLFLHHTRGTTAAGALAWWDQTPARVGTPYLIDRDASIIEAFDPTMWAYHLGVVGDDNYHEKHSIPIEIVSAGGLHKEGDEFRFYPLYPNKLAYTVIPPEEVCTLKKPWKGYKYFHRYTDDQIKSLDWLCRKLIAENPIKVQAWDNKFYQFNKEVIDKHLDGIWSHSTVYESNEDIFPQPELIDMLEKLHKDFKGNRIPEIEVK